jgi:hypothetical protein
MKKITPQISSFIKRNNTSILTGLSIIGVIGTAVMSAQATSKALKALKQARKNSDEPLTKMEVVAVMAPNYIPTVIAGVGTITCILGTGVINKQKQEALTSAYIFLDNSFKEYKKKVAELYGEAGELDVRKAIANNHYRSITVHQNKELFYDELSEYFFESTMLEVLDAEYQYNKMFAESGEVMVSDFYDLLTIPHSHESDIVGFDYMGAEEQGYAWIDFEHIPGKTDDGIPYYILCFSISPHPYYIGRLDPKLVIRDSRYE